VVVFLLTLSSSSTLGAKREGLQLQRQGGGPPTGGGGGKKIIERGKGDVSLFLEGRSLSTGSVFCKRDSQTFPFIPVGLGPLFFFLKKKKDLSLLSGKTFSKLRGRGEFTGRGRSKKSSRFLCSLERFPSYRMRVDPGVFFYRSEREKRSALRCRTTI